MSSRDLEKIIPMPLSHHPHLDWWLNENNVLRGQPLHPLQHTLQMFTDASNEGRGAHLGDSTARGVWSEPESRLHINFFGAKSSLAGPQEFRASLQGSDCPDSNGQHNCGLLYQGRRYEIRLSLCPPLETSVLVSPQRNSSAGSTHSRSLECNSRQTVQAQSGDTDRVVPVSAGVQSLVLKMGPAAGGPICNPFQSQTSQICVTSSGSDSSSTK